MTAWIRTHPPAAIVAGLLVTLAIVVVILYSRAGAMREAAEELDPSAPTIIPAYAEAPLNDLTPALDTTNPLEDTDAVRTIRATYTAIAWFDLVNTSEFAQFARYISSDSPQFLTAPREEEFWYQGFPIGPMPFTPVDIRTTEYGTQIVTVCTARGTITYRPQEDRVDVPSRHMTATYAFEVYPLSDRELVQLSNYDVHPGELRMRMAGQQAADVDCSDVDNVQQLFTDWEDHIVTWRPDPSPEATH